MEKQKFKIRLIDKEDFHNLSGDDLYTRTVHEFFRDTEEYGKMSWYVEYYAYEDYREELCDPEEILIMDEQVDFIINYPLSVDVQITFNNKAGFRRIDIVRCLYEVYKYIYDEETKAVGDPGTYERLYNRRQSYGPYGIWGHYMNDLRLEGMIYFPDKKQVQFLIGS
ncbi:MAG: hypothetical protein BAJALOKI3v1_830002 [Promethearchaeota archaeon]|nr:MAG: hypothetical protein BAJALOKI3v1_830002 [Candidatus Lokiarchaeota archaeon]